MTFNPTDDQRNNLIIPAWEAISCIADELQKDLGCDDAYIKEMLIALSQNYE